MTAPRHQPGPARQAPAVTLPREQSWQVVTLPAEIDAGNDGDVLDTLVRALLHRPDVLVADASRTAFCGCCGARALLAAHHQAAAAGTQLRVAASPAVQRILALTGAGHALDTYPTAAAALTPPARADAQPPPALPGPRAHATRLVVT